ncbi:MAG: hypothetical protein MUO24_03220 [Desulfobacterales bacterium]|nr:hypothetical protein [Desulfobacterales bacterium]
MDAIQKRRPTAVTVIGWIFIAGAILMILSGGLGFMAFSFMNQMAEEMPPIAEELPNQFRIMRIFFQNFGIIALLQVAFAIFVLMASIHFLKLRKWARNAVEIVAWLGLFYVIGFGIFWVVSWIDITSSFPVTEAPAGPPPLFNIIGAVMGCVVTVVWAVPLIIIIIFLRGKSIKDAVS